MRTTAPHLIQRETQHTAGIRLRKPFDQAKALIPTLIAETEAWVEEGMATVTGPPYMRLHVIPPGMVGDADFEVGLPVSGPIRGDGRVEPGVVPAGTYGTLVYTDINQGYESNRVLIDWAAAEGIEWDAWDDPAGHAFAARLEFFLDGPDDNEDPTQWDTELLIKVADS